jgi:hypothetical protein
MTSTYAPLNDDEIFKIVAAVVRGQSHKTRFITRAEAQAEVDDAVAWAASIRVQGALPYMVEAGEFDLLHGDKGELCIARAGPAAVRASKGFSSN